jgi:hypothetical protein
MRVGPAGQELERRLGHVGPQGPHPVRTQDFQQRVQTLHAGRAPTHQPRADLHRPLERITRPIRRLGVQAIWVQQRQTSQQLRIQPVGLGVLGVIGAQICRLFGGHQHHGRPVAPEPRGQRHPSVTGGFHHHQHLVGVTGQLGPEGLEVLGPGPEPVTRPQDLARLIRTSRPMRSPARDVDPQTNLHLLLLSVAVMDGGGHDGGRSTRHSLSEITSSRSGRGVIRFLTGPRLLAGVDLVRHHGQRAKSQHKPLQSLSQQ